MIRSLLFLALLAIGLALVERHLAHEATRERNARARVGRLVSEEEAASWQVRCFEVADGSGQRQLYLPYFGRWRCRTHGGAPVDTAALEALYSSLTQVQGVVQTNSPEDPTQYGIGTSSTWRVTFHGPGAQEPPHSDKIVAFDLGTPNPARGACFVRRVGESAIWLLESNPRAALDSPPVPGLPPLLAPHVIPADWPGWETGLARVRLMPRTGAGFSLEKRVPAPDASIDPRERPPHIWVLDPGPAESLATSLQSTAYTLFLSRLPYLDVRGPREREALGLDQPVATLLLEAAGTEPLQLLLGAALPDGRVPLWNAETGRAYLLKGEVADLLAPPREVFVTESDANPWDPYLRQ